MLREKAKKIVKAIFAGATMALCVAAINPAAQVQAGMLMESELIDSTKSNDTFGLADELPLKTWMKGVSEKNDKDWYKFTITKKGCSQVVLKRGSDNPSANAKWSFYVYDEAKRELFKNRSYVLGLAPGRYYIMVKPVSGAGKKDTYNLKVNYMESDSWENETFSPYEKPNQAVPNKEYTGNLYGQKDKDIYNFKMDGTNGALLTFKIDGSVDISKNPSWKIEFFQNGNKRLESVKIEWGGDLNRKQSKTYQYVRTDEILKIAKCTGNLTVKVTNSCNAVGKIYHLQLEPIVSSVNITSYSASRGQAMLSWNTVNNAQGYYVYRRSTKEPKYEKIATVTGDNKYIDNTVNRNMIYYYKVLAFQNRGSGIITSESSNYVKMRIK